MFVYFLYIYYTDFICLFDSLPFRPNSNIFTSFCYAIACTPIPNQSTTRTELQLNNPIHSTSLL